MLKPQVEKTKKETSAVKKQVEEILNKPNLDEFQLKRIAFLEQKLAMLDDKLNGPIVLPSEVTEDDWIVIAGSDSSVDSAEHEAKKVRKLGFGSRVFLKKSRYQTIVGPFLNKEIASDALRLVKSKVRQSAYLVRQSRWCPLFRKDISGAFLKCQ